MKIIALTNKGKSILGKKKWNLHSFREKVPCLDDQPGYLFVTTDNNNWNGLWVTKNNDKNFRVEE